MFILKWIWSDNIFTRVQQFQRHSKLDDRRVYIHVLVFTDHKNNRFQTKLQNTNLHENFLLFSVHLYLFSRDVIISSPLVCFYVIHITDVVTYKMRVISNEWSCVLFSEL